MVSERYMKPLVDNLIRQIYGEPALEAEEVPVAYGRIDMLYLYDTDPFSVAIELKIKDWSRGLRQAYRNLFYAKYSFLAIQWKRIRSIDLNPFVQYGIGVIAINGNADIVLEPKPSKMFSLYGKRTVSVLRERLAR